MSSCDMQGFATERDLSSLFLELASMSIEERTNKKFALFVRSKGFLNGQEAFEYLSEKLRK